MKIEANTEETNSESKTYYKINDRKMSADLYKNRSKTKIDTKIMDN
jgi:hypothetical protein